MFYIQFILFGIIYFSNLIFFKCLDCSNLLSASIVLLLSWLASFWLTHKHKPKFYQIKINYVLAPFYKAAIFLYFIFFIFLLIFKIEINLSYAIFYSITTYSVIEIIIILVILKTVWSSPNKSEEVVRKSNNITKYEQPLLNTDSKEHIKECAEKLFSKFRNFKNLNWNKTDLLDLISEIPQNISCLVSKKNNDDFIKTSNDIIIDSVKLNNHRRINKNLLLKNKMLTDGGYLIFRYDDSSFIEEKILQKPAHGIFTLNFYIYYFIKRLFPKILFLNSIYFILTNGKNRLITRAEVWGRLSYCGFVVQKEINNGIQNIIISRKLKTISENPNPSYYPVIQLNRVGLHGKIIKINKVRSMSPFSEFIQKEVYELDGISATGKFKNDFRITRTGRIIRKYWIDELPQFIDWFRGEIKLVGIRAMSQHYFSLYPKEYQDLFIRVKPGIISPIFDEETANFEEIVRIEQDYLESYLKNPVKTDIKYFFITFKHILSGVHSK
ncbi:MAG: sugar transferase [Bacteroidales bacterium]|nr:sugar transferase [Bacteroidales bacterium]